VLICAELVRVLLNSMRTGMLQELGEDEEMLSDESGGSDLSSESQSTMALRTWAASIHSSDAMSHALTNSVVVARRLLRTPAKSATDDSSE
jgi:hypothetical protein